MAWETYHNFKLIQENGNAIDLDDNTTTTIKCAILTTLHTKTLTTDSHWSDVSADEVAAGTSYTAGGNAVTGRTVTNSGGTITFDGNDPAQWAQDATGFTNGQYLVLYQDTGTPATSPLMFIHDMGSAKSIQSGPFSVEFSASGIFTKT